MGDLHFIIKTDKIRVVFLLVSRCWLIYYTLFGQALR